MLRIECVGRALKQALRAIVTSELRSLALGCDLGGAVVTAHSRLVRALLVQTAEHLRIKGESRGTSFLLPEQLCDALLTPKAPRRCINMLILYMSLNCSSFHLEKSIVNNYTDKAAMLLSRLELF